MWASAPTKGQYGCIVGQGLAPAVFISHFPTRGSYSVGEGLCPLPKKRVVGAPTPTNKAILHIVGDDAHIVPPSTAAIICIYVALVSIQNHRKLH